MFVELGVIGILKYAHDKYKNLDLYCMKREIKKILQDSKLDYYTVMEVKRSLPWGYEVVISLNGKGFTELETVKENIETKLGYETHIEQNNNLKTATIKIIVLPVTEDTKFQPYETKQYEIYCSLSQTMQALVVNLKKFPHVLVSGQTGCGKTEEIRLILTNLINNHNSRDINIFFSELSGMDDYGIFQSCKQVKGYAKDIRESEKLFTYMMHLYTKRLEIFIRNGCKNISEYNEKFYQRRMSYDYIVMDEMADYFPVKADEDFKLKENVYNMLRHAIRKFRKVGIFLIIGIQRPDTTVLDPSLKSGLCTKIGFSQNNDASSLVVADTNELTNIENRKALLMYGNQKQWFKSLFIDDKLIGKYIKDSIVKDRTKQKDYNKFLAEKETPGEPKKTDKNKEITKVSEVASTSEENQKVIPYKVRLKK
ncbi:FtsK/SpoIIIE domain-containing protein [Clostridium sp. WILCCON 0269]|uniref:FtsK/SpoIIIE domain-containing protein n=1 Tax=Candidatus Clostridium eludens TaxID=3381663 RepID=A0ABW8SPZ9_9CLOT